jgi:hypothetical protein
MSINPRISRPSPRESRAVTCILRKLARGERRCQCQHLLSLLWPAPPGGLLPRRACPVDGSRRPNAALGGELLHAARAATGGRDAPVSREGAVSIQVARMHVISPVETALMGLSGHTVEGGVPNLGGSRGAGACRGRARRSGAGAARRCAVHGRHGRCGHRGRRGRGSRWPHQRRWTGGYRKWRGRRC